MPALTEDKSAKLKPEPTYAKGLYARINNDGRFFWERVQIKRQNPVPLPNATSYFLRYMDHGKRKIVPLGKDLNTAFIEWRNHESDMDRVAIGKAPIYQDRAKERIVIADAVAEYLQDLPTLDKAKATIVAYTNTLEGFVRSCTKIYTDELDRKDIIDYIAWMRKNLPKRKHGEQNRTIRNRLTYLGTFLGQKCGIRLKKVKGADSTAPGLLFSTDAPKYTKRVPDKYSIKTINALLDVANQHEQLLIEFFLYTGCRDEEVAHMEWSDFDGKKIRVQPKPRYSWKVKDHEVRDVDLLPSRFITKLIRYRDSSADHKCNLIFPSGVSKPDKHLVKIIQRVAVRAGLEGRFTLHKMRRTFGSMIAKKFGIPTAQRLLGHKDLQTTARYLAAEDTDTTEAQIEVDNIFRGVKE